MSERTVTVEVTAKKPWPSCWLPECNRPAAGPAGDEPRPCWSHTPDEEGRYPVIVEYTYRHVIWVAGDNQKEAVERAQDAPYEQTNDQETLFDAGWEVRAPKDRWDWRDVMEGGYSHPYQGTEADAHVQSYHAVQARARFEARRAACAADGHPGVRDLPSGPYCNTCGYLPVETVASL